MIFLGSGEGSGEKIEGSGTEVEGSGIEAKEGIHLMLKSTFEIDLKLN